MLLGEFNHTLDNKNLVSVPASMRAELGADFMVVRSLRGQCLRVFSKPAWDAYVEPLKHKDRKISEPTLWYLYHDAMQTTPDSLGRIRISKELLSFIGVNPDETCADRNVELVVVGCGDYSEIWAKENYEAHVSGMDMEAIVRALEESGL